MEFVLRNLKEGNVVYLDNPYRTKHIVYANNGVQVLLRHYNDNSYFHILDLETGMSAPDFTYCALTPNKNIEREKVNNVAEAIRRGNKEVKIRLLERGKIPISEDISLF